MDEYSLYRWIQHNSGICCAIHLYFHRLQKSWFIMWKSDDPNYITQGLYDSYSVLLVLRIYILAILFQSFPSKSWQLYEIWWAGKSEWLILSVTSYLRSVISSVRKKWLLFRTSIKSFMQGTSIYFAGAGATHRQTTQQAYRQVSNIRRTLVSNKIVDHSDVVGASPVGAAPTASSFST